MSLQTPDWRAVKMAVRGRGALSGVRGQRSFGTKEAKSQISFLTYSRPCFSFFPPFSSFLWPYGLQRSFLPARASRWWSTGRRGILSCASVTRFVLIRIRADAYPRSRDVALPVDKIYGVNVRGFALFLPQLCSNLALVRKLACLGTMDVAHRMARDGRRVLRGRGLFHLQTKRLVSLKLPRTRTDQRGLSETYVRTRLSFYADVHPVLDWKGWLTQEDVDGIAAVGMNTVRLPLPFWIVEDIVDLTHEPYAQGGLDELVS